MVVEAVVCKACRTSMTALVAACRWATPHGLPSVPGLGGLAPWLLLAAWTQAAVARVNVKCEYNLTFLTFSSKQQLFNYQITCCCNETIPR